jgi:hypothetical protein
MGKPACWKSFDHLHADYFNGQFMHEDIRVASKLQKMAIAPVMVFCESSKLRLVQT